MDFVGIMAAVPIGGAIFHIWVMLLWPRQEARRFINRPITTTLNLLYFARLRDALGCGQKPSRWTAPPRWPACWIRCARRRVGRTTGRRAQLSRGGQPDCRPRRPRRADGDEVAIFPPVTGVEHERRLYRRRANCAL